MPVRVGLILSTNIDYHRSIIRGLRAAAPRSWEFIVVPAWERRDGWLSCWNLDGLVYSQDNPALGKAVDALGIPCVNLSYLRGGRAAVLPDNAGCGRLAARFFADLGCASVGFCPMPGQAFSTARSRGMHEEAGRLGLRMVDDAPAEPQRRQGWLRSLPPGSGVLAANDLLALTVLGELRQLGIAVPGGVRLCGVDDDAFAAALADPPLTSIPLPMDGLVAAIVHLLREQLAGRPVPFEPQLIPFPAPVRRASTGPGDGLDRALALMREQLARPLRIPELATAAGMPRRTFEMRFRTAHGMSPLQMLNRLRVDRAAELLRSGDDLAAIARACGLASPARLIRTFRAMRGTTPGRWRRA